MCLGLEIGEIGEGSWVPGELTLSPPHVKWSHPADRIYHCTRDVILCRIPQIQSVPTAQSANFPKAPPSLEQLYFYFFILPRTWSATDRHHPPPHGHAVAQTCLLDFLPRPMDSSRILQKE